MFFWLCSVWIGELGFLYKFDLMYSIVCVLRCILYCVDGVFVVYGLFFGLLNFQMFCLEVLIELFEEQMVGVVY